MDTVLLVESEAITRYAWTEALVKRGYGVLGARDSTEAFDLLRTQGAIVSALIVEDLVSDERARNLACEMKKVNPKLCVIASCTFCSDDLPSYVPYHAALEKPATPRDLLNIVEQLLLPGKNSCSN